MVNVAVKPQPASAGETDLVGVFNEIRRELLATLVGLLGNHEDAQDALQIAFLNCWQARAGILGVRDVRAWVWRVSLNAGRDLLRNAWRRRARPWTPAAVASRLHWQTPADAAADREDHQRLRDALASLRPEEKEVFLLRQNGRLTWEEIAEVRSCPVGTVKTQMRAALYKLRQILAGADKTRSTPPRRKVTAPSACATVGV